MNEDCPHCVFEKTEANCRGCFEGSHYKPKPVTNADRIRSMTDEELAKFESTLGCHHDARRETCLGVDRCADCWLDWLREEVTE